MTVRATTFREGNVGADGRLLIRIKVVILQQLTASWAVSFSHTTPYDRLSLKSFARHLFDPWIKNDGQKKILLAVR